MLAIVLAVALLGTRLTQLRRLGKPSPYGSQYTTGLAKVLRGMDEEYRVQSPARSGRVPQ